MLRVWCPTRHSGHTPFTFGTILSRICLAGYYKVTTDQRDPTRQVSFRAFRIGHAKTGGYIGRFATAVEAAVEVAKDANERGLSHAVVQQALDNGLKGQDMINALETAKGEAAVQTVEPPDATVPKEVVGNQSSGASVDGFLQHLDLQQYCEAFRIFGYDGEPLVSEACTTCIAHTCLM